MMVVVGIDEKPLEAMGVDEPKLLTIKEFAEKHKDVTSIWTIRDAVKRGDIPSARWGSRIFIPEDALETFLRKQLERQAS